MNRSGLDRLFKPRAIAVIGGGAWCRSVIGALRGIGFSAPVWHVHPSAERAFRSIADLPDAPDACFIGVNRGATVGCVRELSVKGAGGAVCFASGFAETDDGAEFNTALLEAAGDMAIVGPNCYGFVNALDGVALWPDVHGLAPVESGVAILTQSSNIALNMSMQRRGLPIAFLGTAGNQAQIELTGIAQHLLQDPRITALGLYIEGIGDVLALQALMQDAHRLGKAVIALKSGQSLAAQTAALSHTASLSGSDVGASALFDRLGIVRVSSLDALIEALKHAHLFGVVSPGPIASVSCSGGEASLMADGGAARGLRFAALTETQDRALEAVLGPRVTRANPLDYHTFIWNDAARMTEVYAAMAKGPAALTAIVADFPRHDRCTTTAWDCVETAAIAARRASGKPVAVLASLAEGIAEDRAMRLMTAGVLPINGMEAGLDAIAALYNRPVRPDPERSVLAPRPCGRTRMLEEAEAKLALAAFGAVIPRHAIATSIEQAVVLSADLVPIALKARGLAHKSERGGVVLGLDTPDAVGVAARKMGASEFFLEEMVSDGVAELLIGVLQDNAHGYVLALGAGGVHTELWQDVVHLLLPITADEVTAALDRLRITPLLSGYRGKPAANRKAIVDAVMAVQAYVIALEGRVAEVEVNPLIVSPTRAVVADTLIRGDL